MSRCRRTAVVLFVAWSLVSSIRGADPFWGADPAWTLVHEPAVAKELRLSRAEREEMRRLLDELDVGFFHLRNRPQEEAAEGVKTTLADLTERLGALLSETQMRRLGEIQARQLGTAALLRPGLATMMEYAPRQKDELERVIGDTAAATKALERRLADGEPREALEERYRELKQDELRNVNTLLNAAQKAAWKRALGRDFDLEQLGRATFKAPEFVDSGEWLNSDPLTLESLAGSVVVLHFYAFGCINCVRNFPTYVEWQDRFRDERVVIIGIHTPETAEEEDAATVRDKAAEAGFSFPVLIDREKDNWNAWGNSMWPSVYLIDKRGYLRHFWPGELKWQGAKGDEWMRERIEELLAEPASP